jgi:hypothetical protein
VSGPVPDSRNRAAKTGRGRGAGRTSITAVARCSARRFRPAAAASPAYSSADGMGGASRQARHTTSSAVV